MFKLSVTQRSIIEAIVLTALYVLVFYLFRKTLLSKEVTSAIGITSDIAIAIGALGIFYYYYRNKIQSNVKVQEIALGINKIWDEILLYLQRSKNEIPELVAFLTDNVSVEVIKSSDYANQPINLVGSANALAMTFINSKFYEMWVKLMELQALCGCSRKDFTWLFSIDKNKYYNLLQPTHILFATVYVNKSIYKWLIDGQEYYPKQYIKYIDDTIKFYIGEKHLEEVKRYAKGDKNGFEKEKEPEWMF